MILQHLTTLAATDIIVPCQVTGGDFLGFPKWYKYLGGIQSKNPFSDNTNDFICSPHLNGLTDVWLVLAAVIEILLRIAVLAAIGYIIYGGVKYITSQGQPDQTAVALRTIINAVAGLVISIAATAIISFIAGRFT